MLDMDVICWILLILCLSQLLNAGKHETSKLDSFNYIPMFPISSEGMHADNIQIHFDDLGMTSGINFTGFSGTAHRKLLLRCFQCT